MEAAQALHDTTCCTGCRTRRSRRRRWSRWAPLANPFDPSQGFVDEDYEKPYDPWEDDDEASRRGRGAAGAAYLDIAALRAKAKK